VSERGLAGRRESGALPATHSGPRGAQGAWRLVHYWWPVVMAWSIAQVVEGASPLAASSAGLCALLFGGLAAYSVDRIGDAEPRWLRFLLLGGCLAAGAGGLAVLPLLPWSKIALLVAFGMLALAYPWLKRLRFGKTLLVPAVWTWAVLALPTVDGSPLAWRAVAVPLAAPLSALLTAGCLLCDVKDCAADRRAGVPSMPATFGIRPTLLAAALIAALGGALAFEQHRAGLLAGAVCLIALSPWQSLLASETLGPLAVDLALTVPGVLVVLRWV